ncbi:Hypothetical protein CFH99_0070 [Nocardioides aromaticivorans]|uniref:Uncharacterized protein n=1 Tax=Nocardioides aromaticivorans TaxID=200618 RepID=A0ABX7PT68_9ACTN|nr:hypothetical protein [Nocardioides aromaticivorans]QSR28890.1 Hypothetical protein CFH99_0070 [Nocardioides aromaticivorans]
MARIRTIKPEFWTDETVVELDYADRLLFIGMWNFADDQGFMPLRVKRIKMQVFPGDDYDVEAGLRRLHESSLVALYAHPSGLLIHVRNWSRHQRISNPSREKYLQSDLRELDEWPVGLAMSLEPYPAEGKGREGKGRDLSCASADAEREPDPLATDFDRWYDTYPRKRGKGQAFKAYRAARKKVDAPTLLDALASQLATLTARGPEYVPYPATWLNGERWADEPDNVRPIRPDSDGRLQLPPLPPRGFFDR